MSGISDPLLTIDEVAEYLRVSISTMRNKNFRERLGLKSVRIGRSVRFRRQEVEDFVYRNVEGERQGC